MVKRIIFDLDDTLIRWNDEWWQTVSDTFEFYHIPYDENILPNLKKAVNHYIDSCQRMDKVEMSQFLSNELNILLPDSFVETWTDLLGECTLEDSYQLASFLKNLSIKYSLTIASNWFYSQQVRKLERLGILQYFDEVVTADKFIRKPYSEMYDYLSKEYQKDEVIVVGDSYEMDIKCAINLGIHAYFITVSDLFKSCSDYTVISSIYDLKNYL